MLPQQFYPAQMQPLQSLMQRIFIAIGLPLLLIFGASPAMPEETQNANQVLKVRLLAERGVNPRPRVQWAILELALQKSGRAYDLDVSTLPTAPDRTSKNLTIFGDGGNLMIGAPRPEREVETLVVQLPLLRGMLQYWQLWARKNDIPRFADLKTDKDLAKFSVIQGLKWSTIPGFEKLGITVIEGDSSNMPKMLAKGRADLMPYTVIGSRGTFPDIDEYDLATLKNVMLIWPADHFFMVDKNNQALHDALYEGLLRAFEDGSHAELLRTHPSTKDTFANMNLDSNHLIHVENPYMTPNAEAAIEKYGVSPAEIFGK